MTLPQQHQAEQQAAALEGELNHVAQARQELQSYAHAAEVRCNTEVPRQIAPPGPCLQTHALLSQESVRDCRWTSCPVHRWSWADIRAAGGKGVHALFGEGNSALQTDVMWIIHILSCRHAQEAVARYLALRQRAAFAASRLAAASPDTTRQVCLSEAPLSVWMHLVPSLSLRTSLVHTLTGGTASNRQSVLSSKTKFIGNGYQGFQPCGDPACLLTADHSGSYLRQAC